MQILVALNLCTACKRIGAHALMDFNKLLQIETTLNRAYAFLEYATSMLALTLQGRLIRLLNNPKLDGAITLSLIERHMGILQVNGFTLRLPSLDG